MTKSIEETIDEAIAGMDRAIAQILKLQAENDALKDVLNAGRNMIQTIEHTIVDTRTHGGPFDRAYLNLKDAVQACDHPNGIDYYPHQHIEGIQP